MRIRFNNTAYRKKSLRGGMTLIEMLVAVSILAMIILAFGTILTQAQKVVKTSQTNMRTNSTVSAIAQVIRQDFRQLTRSGFLCITQTNGSVNSVPRLLFTTAGTTRSKTLDVTGQYGIPVYGTIKNQLYDPHGTEYKFGTYSCLVCQKWVLNPNPNPTTILRDVWWDYDLLEIQKLSRVELSNNFIGTNTTGLLNAFPKDDDSAGPNVLYVPPRNADDLDRLWEVLSNETSRLSVMWTDGTKTSNVLNWYGILYNDFDSDGHSPTNRKRVPRDPDWETKTINDVTDEEFEFNIPDVPNPADSNYRALWTHRNQTNWPKAIRISFVIYDKTMAEGMQVDDEAGDINVEARSKRYEVICPIGQ